MRLLHPFMPFITEELHHALYQGNPERPCMLSEYPQFAAQAPVSEEPLQAVTEIRNIRNARNIAPKEKLEVVINTSAGAFKENLALIEKLANCSVNLNVDVPAGSISALAGTAEVFVVLPQQDIDPEQEKLRINEEISYLQGFLKSVEAKLGNERFVANAKPEVVDKEKQKKADAEQKIANLQRQLSAL